jgi:cytochrome c-type biogenesis protein CcmH
MRRIMLALWLAAAAAVPAYAVQPDEVLANATLETRARTLSRELRCMVCQNQSIDDSDAPLARDLRILVRDRLSAGDSDAQVIDFLVARYGEFVLLKPRFECHTALLWAVPPGVVVIGGLVLWSLRRKSRDPGDRGSPTLTAAEQAKLATLVDSDRAETAP